MSGDAELSALLIETPPAPFAERANTQPEIFERTHDDPLAFWAEQAARLLNGGNVGPAGDRFANWPRGRRGHQRTTPRSARIQPVRTSSPGEQILLPDLPASMPSDPDNSATITVAFECGAIPAETLREVRGRLSVPSDPRKNTIFLSLPDA